MRVILVARTKIERYVPNYQWEPININEEVDELAEMAGRLCYLSWDRPNPKTATNKGYLENIVSQQHFSVLEHASATFYIDGVSRNFTHELIRHRHLSFSEVSQRYVDVGEFDFVVHPGLNDLPMGALGIHGEQSWENKGFYRKIVDTLIGQGKSRKEARQAARHVLPSGLETKILVTGNMRAWRDMLPKRLSLFADEEFRLVAQKILAELREIAPNTFQDFE